MSCKENIQYMQCLGLARTRRSREHLPQIALPPPFATPSTRRTPSMFAPGDAGGDGACSSDGASGSAGRGGGGGGWFSAVRFGPLFCLVKRGAGGRRWREVKNLHPSCTASRGRGTATRALQSFLDKLKPSVSLVKIIKHVDGELDHE